MTRKEGKNYTNCEKKGFIEELREAAKKGRAMKEYFFNPLFSDSEVPTAIKLEGGLG